MAAVAWWRALGEVLTSAVSTILRIGHGFVTRERHNRPPPGASLPKKRRL
jgi:hypothetical protein